MKSIAVFFSVIFSVFLFTPVEGNSGDLNKGNAAISSGGEKTSFIVYGSCGMCKQRIEKAAKSVDGVKHASWDQEEQMLTIKYDSDKVDVMKVHEVIAAVGHDTEKVKAADSKYQNLPDCCKYRED
ncbi:MAG: heavy-metal-associated domain-containing protein [Bacteroidota bacterium]